MIGLARNFTVRGDEFAGYKRLRNSRDAGSVSGWRFRGQFTYLCTLLKNSPVAVAGRCIDKMDRLRHPALGSNFNCHFFLCSHNKLKIMLAVSIVKEGVLMEIRALRDRA